VRESARVVVISPDRLARQAIGRNVLDPARRSAAAKAGHRQAASCADEIASVWHPRQPT
jgi:NTE family protein